MYSQQYLNNLITNRVEESLTLDYKASGALERTDKKTQEISKDVSALANSAGGSLIYGIKEDADNKHLPSKVDSIDRDRISKEWLEQIIQSTIQPRIEGVKIIPIEIDGDKNKVVYIVDVPKSATAHQAIDKRYYRRFNFNSVPMEDYEIRDVFNRPKNPLISIEFEVDVKSAVDGRSYYLKLYARNTGAVLAKYINCYITIPNKCLEGLYSHTDNTKIKYFADNTVRDIVDTRVFDSPIYKYGPSRYDPLLPRMRTKLDLSKIELHDYYADSENQIEWIVYADNAEPVTGIIKMSDIPQIRD